MGALLDESDWSVCEPTSDNGGSFVRSHHCGHFKMARTLCNYAARYGTFGDRVSKEGDTANTDAIVTADGRYGDILCTHGAGEAGFCVCCSAETIHEGTWCGSEVAKFGVMSGDTGYVT